MRRAAWLPLVFLGALVAEAQEAPPDSDKIQKLSSLSPEQLDVLKMRLEQFKKMPKEEQQRLRDNLQKLKTMNPEQVKKVRERAAKLTDAEKKEYAELASGFFRWAHRSGQLDGFPRGLFFSWLKNEHPEKMEEIRAMEPGPGGPRVDALVKLSDEFRDVVVDRAEIHTSRHKCADLEFVTSLREAPSQDFWRLYQDLQRACSAAPRGRGNRAPARGKTEGSPR